MTIDVSIQSKERVRQATDIVELIGGYLSLRRQGHHYVGLCPWHDDTRPSLQVNPERQSFRCWVCNIGGDVFSFIMQTESVDFRGALQMLAEKVGISLARERVGSRSPATTRVDEKARLYQAMAWAEEEYHHCLVSAPEAQRARKYLEERQIHAETAQKFHLGYAPNQWNWLQNRAKTTSFEPHILERVGLIHAPTGGRGQYDRFRGRVLFSIRDVQSRPVALGGRILPELAGEATAKYINSPETPLFHKNQQLYGLDQAKASITKQGGAVVVEGYTDCVIAHQFGYTNVVAVLGTALGEQQIELLRRFAESVTLMLDGDEAGQRRANQILELFVARQVDLKILTLPEKYDPCDFLIAHGSEAFSHFLASAVDALEHKIRTVTKGLDSADTHQANVALEDILGTLCRAPRLTAGTSSALRLREEQILSRLAHRFVVSETHLRDRVIEMRRKVRKNPLVEKRAEISASESIGQIDPWDRELLEFILALPGQLPTISEAIRTDDLTSSAGRRIYAKCLELSRLQITPDVDRLMLELEDSNLRNLLSRLEECGRAKAGSDRKLELQQILENYRRRTEDSCHISSIASLRKGGQEESQQETFDQLFVSLKHRHRRSAPRDG